MRRRDPRDGISWLACALALGIAVAPSPAAAFELFGIHLWGKKKAEVEDTIGEPQPYSVDFAVSGEKDTDKALKGASTLWKDREKPASGASGLLALARADYRRLLATLYAEGRYGGTISITIDGREAADLPPDAEIANPATVRIAVDPGPLFRFGEARVLNEAPPPTERGDEVDRPDWHGFKAGEVAESGVILQAEKLAVEAWRQQGHAKARIAQRRVEAAHDADIVDATLEVEPGRKAAYGATSVEGAERMDPEFIRYMADLEPGEEFDPDAIARANKRLSRLDVFRSLRIEEGAAIGDDGLLPISILVQERALRRFGIGGTFSTLDGVGLEGYWLHRNLFGRAERLRLDARVGGLGQTFQPDELTYRLAAAFTKPGVFTPDTDFTASLLGDREVLESYTRTAANGEVGFTHIFTDSLSGRAFVRGGTARFDDAIGTREFTTLGLLAGLNFDNRDNKTDATEGFYVDVEIEPFHEFHYGNPAVKLTAEGRAYFGFGPDERVVLAGRLKVGTLFGAPIEETPPDKLFFAGGGGSVRGYAYRNIGVDGPMGTVLGGKSLLEGSVELRARVTDTIGVVGFVDAGYVGANSIPKFSEDLRLGVGGGVRYLTGLGPIRLDVAMPLDPRAGDPDVAFYVGIGQAF